MTFKVDGKEYVHERTTATQQTGFTFVAQSRNWLPNAVGGFYGLESTMQPVQSTSRCSPALREFLMLLPQATAA
ncbi:MAG: hypothetical protein V8S95_04485 [Odoribacter sp.]